MANGCNQNPIGACSEAEGINTTANGTASHAEGINTIAGGEASHSEGSTTIAGGNSSHSEGYNTETTAATAHAEGSSTTASGIASHSEGYLTNANGNTSHTEGSNTTAGGNASHAEGYQTNASADSAHAEGQQTQATGVASHAEGFLAVASGDNSHAEGFFSTASIFAAHAEGYVTNSNGIGSHAEGQFTTADAAAAHTEGANTTASGIAAHAEGQLTQANGDSSHAEGENTTVGVSFSNSHIMGRFGDANEANSWFIGNGTSSVERGLGAKWSGTSFDMFVDGMYLSPAADYAEMFETEDGNPIDVGYFVTAVEKGKIKKGTASDHFILGITSATPSLLGNSAGLRWQGKYLTDDWGRKRFHEVTIPAKKDKEGNILTPERKEMQAILNPAWNFEVEYIPRIERKEWVAVGLLGQILVRDDGTCKEQGYCLPNDDGIATKAEKGYFVLKRTGVNQVLVLFK